MLYLDDQTIAAVGDVLGQNFTEGQLNELIDLLAHAAEGCDYAADDLGERADFERKHNGSEEDDYTEAGESYSETSGSIAKLTAAIQIGRDIHA